MKRFAAVILATGVIALGSPAIASAAPATGSSDLGIGQVFNAFATAISLLPRGIVECGLGSFSPTTCVLQPGDGGLVG